MMPNKPFPRIPSSAASNLLIVMTVLTLGAMSSASLAQAGVRPSGEEPADNVMGDYVGPYQALPATAGSSVAQSSLESDAKVIAQGGGRYRVVLTVHDDKTPHFSVVLNGTAEGDSVALAGQNSQTEWKGKLDGGKTLVAESAAGKFDLKFTIRRSPTEGMKPPSEAIELIPSAEGKPPSMDEWIGGAWKPMDDGSVMVNGGDTHTKRKFGDFRMHAEFRIPLEPTGRGQDRGNSGFYIHDLYELQVLDSYGLPIAANECGAIYTQVAPKENACFPPKSWQTYDVTFHAARFDDTGKKIKNATITVMQNGVKVQDETSISGPTGAARSRPEVPVAVLRLQDHNHPVRFRNVWLVELKEGASKP
jgi:hypothetical protein